MCILFLQGYSQTKQDNLIDIEELDIDHPLLDIKKNKKYYSLDVNELLDISEQKCLEIEELLYSMRIYLEKSKCLRDEKKEILKISIDSLDYSFDLFLNSSQEIENFSYGRGSKAGTRSLIYRIVLQEDYIKYLKYWFNSFYYVYLEPGVIDCPR